MTPTLVKTLDMTPITVNVTTAGNSNVNATENYRRKKEIRTYASCSQMLNNLLVEKLTKQRSENWTFEHTKLIEKNR